MPKKLMLNNYSENGMLPIMDGLICWLDGRDGKNDDTIWKDRSGNGNDFKLNGFTFNDENGWMGSNLKINFGQYAIREITLPEEYAIEVDLYCDGFISNDQTTFFYYGDGNTTGKWRELTFRKTGSGVKSISASFSNYVFDINKDLNAFLGTKINLVFIGKKGSISLYRDGVVLYQKDMVNVVTNITSNFNLGCGRNLDRFSKARFNSVKIYNRVLTEEEIQHNYLYEQSIERGE